MVASTPSVSALEIGRDCGKNWQVISLPSRSDNADAFRRKTGCRDVVDGKEHWYLQSAACTTAQSRPGR